MIHDPLCPMGKPSLKWTSCDWCGLIAKVRKDESQHAFQWQKKIESSTIAKCIEALPHSTYCLDTWYDDNTSECFCESAACDRILRALLEKP
jgi:hypothetical protein